MKDEKIMELMRNISPRFTEKAAAVAAESKRVSAEKSGAILLPAIGLTAGALMCTAIIGGAIYAGTRPREMQIEDTAFSAEESAEVTTTTRITTASTAPDSAVFSFDTTAAQTETTTVMLSETTGTTTRTETTTTATEQSLQTQTAQQEEIDPLGDIDGDKAVTYADYMLANMYETYLKLPKDNLKRTYPQMLTEEQIEQYQRVRNSGEIAAIVREQLQSVDLPQELLPVWRQPYSYPELLGEVMEADRILLDAGYYAGLEPHVVCLSYYYINQLQHEEPMIVSDERYNEAQNEITISEVEVPMFTAEQVDGFLNYIRTVCLERYAELDAN